MNNEVTSDGGPNHQNLPKLSSAFQSLSPLAERLAARDEQLSDICRSYDKSIVSAAKKLRRQLSEFEPNITMIGQVKSGKTTLINALAGWQDLLPADVNPWTSVVTSVHMQPDMKEDERRSSFQFFSNEEWDQLIRKGGRVGEIACRAGAEEELEKVRRQLDEMREKSRKRLGRRFQMLLGQSHDYDCFDEALIQRYVCLGDDFWEEFDGSPDQGRFADITKSADLWFSKPDLPVKLCFQDTPGVNDTFMIREQITINTLRNSRLCVMVMTAQQALSSIDLGLIRLISNVRARDIIIFVSRIDELDDPAREVPEIRKSIRDTLRKFHGPVEAEIVFGSGYWASHAVAGTCDQLGEGSAEALLSWAESELDAGLADKSPHETIWTLSGLPALGRAISERIETGIGAKLEQNIDTAISNLNTSLVAYTSVADIKSGAENGCVLSSVEIAREFETIEKQAFAKLDTKLSQTENTFLTRIENARQTFLTRATSSLIKHLNSFGDGEVWEYDPSGLRILLRSAYQVFVRGASKAGQDVFETAADEISALYQSAFELQGQNPRIAPPPLPVALPPIALGQTIALDLRGSWWTRFWRQRRGYEAFSDDFTKLLHEETVPIVATLREQNAEAYSDAMCSALREFIAEQHEIVSGLVIDQTHTSNVTSHLKKPAINHPSVARTTTFLRTTG
ncbi:MAG: dynamin family protein [Paracoccaceae bacterium]